MGNELLPRGTHVVAQSIKDPNPLKINVWVFNYRQGVQINYTLNGTLCRESNFISSVFQNTYNSDHSSFDSDAILTLPAVHHSKTANAHSVQL